VLLRRLVTIPLLFVSAALLLSLFPLLFVIAWLTSRFTWAKGAVPAFWFVLGYLVFEVNGMTRLFLAWLLHRNDPDYIDRNRAVQYWWANALKGWVSKCFRLNFTCSGEATLEGPPCLVLPRHASLADTVVPIVFYGSPQGVRLRYVLKRELLWDPCLDVGGNRVPCHFVDRTGQDSEAAIEGVKRLTATVGPVEGVAMFPEGTRFSPKKAERLATSAKEELRTLANRWPNLLPPRLGGTLAMLQANPGLDILFIAHSGFEPAGELHDLLSGKWLGASIRLHFWRVKFEDIPAAPHHREFLYQQWDYMQRCITNLSAGVPCEPA
jgi:1-acyl-sn-glycerol-3-phosphate acyltransferase